MIFKRIYTPIGILALSACQSVPDAKTAKLSSAPDTVQSNAIITAVHDAMGRTDLNMDPGRLVDTSILIVRPIAVTGLTDRVPGTPTRFTLMSTGERCYLLEAGGDRRIDLPSLPCL